MGKKVLIIDDDRERVIRVLKALRESNDDLEYEVVSEEESEERSIGVFGGPNSLQGLADLVKEFEKCNAPTKSENYFTEKKPRRRGQRKGWRDWE